MDIQGKNILVLGGAGMVGMAVCRELLLHEPALLLIAARRRHKAEQAVSELGVSAAAKTQLRAVWGDVMLRTLWQRDDGGARERVLSDAATRSRMIADTLEPLSAEIIEASLLVELVTSGGGARVASDIVIDCMNTATALGYQNVYAAASQLAELTQREPGQATAAPVDWAPLVESLLSSLAVPQLVRHIQLLHEAMRRAKTQAYIKVGTSGTGGMGFNIPYTHGEEKPSRMLLSKAALAGAQTSLTFLMARTPGGPTLVKELKPSAMIAWRSVGWGEVLDHGRHVPMVDCDPEHCVSIHDPQNLVPHGEFGSPAEGVLRGVYIDTGENGLYSADEFATITTLGQMQIVTPEEIAADVVRELRGAATGHDVVSALDASVMGPSFRGGYLRAAALSRLRQLEAIHGPGVAFEQLGPPRLSKLLFEAHLLRSVAGSLDVALAMKPEALAAALAERIKTDVELRQRILSIGVAILLPCGQRLLRGPHLKAVTAHAGFVDLTADNMRCWQQRLQRLRHRCGAQRSSELSSAADRTIPAAQPGNTEPAFFEPSELAAFIFEEEGGRRQM